MGEIVVLKRIIGLIIEDFFFVQNSLFFYNMEWQGKQKKLIQKQTL